MRKFFSLMTAILFAGSMMADSFAPKALAEITANDVVIVTMQKGDNVFAMSNDNGTSNPPAAVAVTVADDGKISTDATNILWTVTKNGENLSFSAGESYLYCNNTNNGVRVGANEGTFIISEDYLCCTSTSSNRFLGVYNSQDWRCYTTINSNIGGQTLAFFVKEAGGEPGGDPEPEPEPEPGVLGDGYYLVGTMNAWTPAAEYKFGTNPDNEAEMVLANVELLEGAELKVRQVENGELTTWFPGADNYVVDAAHAGVKDIYFRADYAGGDDWYYNCIYIAANEDPEPQPVDPNSFTIVFNETGTENDGTASVTTIEDIIAEGAEYVSAIPTATKICKARTGRGIKFGNSSTAGLLELTLAQPVEATSIVVTAMQYKAGEQTLKIQDKEDYETGEEMAEYVYTYAQATQISSIVLGTVTKRGYIKSVTVNVAGGETPEPEPEVLGDGFYLVGTMNGWTPAAEYKFAANPEDEAEMVLANVELLEGAELKVRQVENGELTTWFPGADNYVVDAAHAGVKDIYFRSNYSGGDDWFYNCIYIAANEEPVTPLYNVAEAIAAGLAENDEIMVRGIVTKIEFKGKNFARYGSANIYVADATGADGEFEFYNCYSFNADTFRVSSPEYDAASTTFAEFDMIADEFGNEIHLGDTVIAFGKYQLYNAIHELKTGCNIVEVKHAEGGVEPEPEPQPIEGYIYNWSNVEADQIGISMLDGAEVATVKIHTNTDEIPAVKFSSSTNRLTIKPAQGGFLAGDKVNIAVCFNNSDDTKQAQIKAYAADGTTELFMTVQGINGRTSADDLFVETFVLNEDQESIHFARHGNTATYITTLYVVREGGDTPEPELENGFYLLGTMNEWTPAIGYQFTDNLGAENEMVLEGVELAEGAEFKVAYVENGDAVTWFPGADNYVVDAAHAGVKDIYFRSNYSGGDDWFYNCIYVAANVEPETPLYEVAEAIAAGLNDDDEIMVRGIITKIEFKGKNFAKYGSANIYVADVNGAEGVFEFYNCYSFNADTFRVSSPEYDATSTAWAEFDMVADEFGNEIHVGDTVIAFGKYKLYNTTHELNTGCYIVDVKPAVEPQPQPEPVEDGYYLVGNMNNWTTVEDYMFEANPAAEGEYMLSLSFEAGDEFKVRLVENSEEATWYPAQAANCTIYVAGNYTVYFRPNCDGGADWYEGCILVVANSGSAIINAEAAKVAVKQLRNGMVIIRRGDREYSIMGQLVK